MTTAPKGPSVGTQARSSGRSEAQWDELERLARATDDVLASGWWTDVCGWNNDETDDEGDDAFSINSAHHGCFAKVVTRISDGSELDYDDVAAFIAAANPATVLELITAARQGRGGGEATQSRSAQKPSSLPAGEQELREKVEIVEEWLAMAKDTLRPLHSSLNYVPISASEFEAVRAILAALQARD